MKKLRYDGAEVVISIPCERVYKGGAYHEAGSAESYYRALDEAAKVAGAIRRTLSQYETGCDDPAWQGVTEPVCEHCGARWTERDDAYNGGCCDADQAPEDAREAAAQEALGERPL